MSNSKSKTFPVVVLTAFLMIIVLTIAVLGWMWVAMLVSGAMWINFGILGAYGFWQMLPVGVVLALLSSALQRKG